ncbi:MAG: RDD family protein [Actinomycetota bacterium]|nr:RDD family protein [Actinomycetota bacterium]
MTASDQESVELPEPPRQELAGFWIRFGAALIDWLLVSLVAGAIAGAFGLDFGLVRTPAPGGGFEARIVTGPTELLSLVYFTYFHGTPAGQTVGNRVAGIRVVDQAAFGTSIGYARAFLRVLVSYISGFVLLLGYLWMLWDDRKQTWHDKAARSSVVLARSDPPSGFGMPRSG